MTSAIGVVLSLILTYWKFRADFTCDASPLSACEVGPGFSCAIAFSSGWSTLLGLPLTIYAAALYVVTLGLAARLFVGAGLRSRRLAHVLGLLSLWNLGVSVFMAGVAALELHTICLYCALLYLLSLLLLGAVTILWVGLPEDARATLRSPRQRSALGDVARVALVFGVVVTAQGLAYQRAQDAVARRSCAPGPVILPETDLEYGRGDAAVVLAMFVDPACPSCRREFESLKALVDDRPERVSLRLYHYPRERGACGPPGFEVASAASTANHACEAARAVACVEALVPGRGVEMLERAFGLQDGPPGEPYFTRRGLARLAGAVGLPVDPEDPKNPLYMCMRGNAAVAARIAEHMAFGEAQGITLTPHTYVIPRGSSGALEWSRGRVYAGVKPRAFVDEMIVDALRGERVLGDRGAHDLESDYVTR
ncbi:MAG: thioredoxin domain-containing protein [Myxococcales bacterium]|nr:thioredoxin domain-containing protein [Myxococcales bacterium]